MTDLGPRPSFIGCWDYQSLWIGLEPDDITQQEDIDFPTEGVEDQELLRQLPYGRYLSSKHWKFVRSIALCQADHRCTWCGATEQLDVHHLTYDRRGRERLADLMVLCRKCHAAEHGRDPDA